MNLRNVILNLIFFAVFFGGVYWLFNQPAGDLPKVDPALEQYVIEWRYDLEDAGIAYENGFCRIDSIIVSDSRSSEFAGHFNKANGCVEIARTELEKCGPTQLKVLLYHELGHYVFDLEHCDHCLIMNPTLKSEQFYLDNWEWAMSEYINQCSENEFEAKY